MIRRLSWRTAAGILSTLYLTLIAGCPLISQPTTLLADLGFNTGRALYTAGVDDQPSFAASLLDTTATGKTGVHAPTIAAFADGELLVAWYAYRGPGELDEAAVYLMRRPADTTTWSTPVALPASAVAHANPVLYAEGDAVWLFTAVVPGTGWSTAHVEVRRSADRGVTWGEPVQLGGPLGTNVRFPPVRLADHTLLLPAYDDLWPRALFFTSADGEQWTLRSAVTAAGITGTQPALAFDGQGNVWAVLRNTIGGWLWVTRSTDGGRTWATPIDSGFPNPGSPAALQRLADGALLLIFNDSLVARHPLSATISYDDGATWTSPRVLVDGTGSYAYPAVTQTTDETVHIVYSHARTAIGYIACNAAWLAGAPAADE